MRRTKAAWTWAAAALVLLSGCVTQRRCIEKFPPVISVKDTVIYRDTVIYVTLPPDTVFNSDTIILTKNGDPVTIKPLVTETDFARAEAWVKDFRLYQKLYNKDTQLELKYDSLLKIKQTVITKTIEIPCKKTPVLNKVIIILSIIFAGGVLLFIRGLTR